MVEELQELRASLFRSDCPVFVLNKSTVSAVGSKSGALLVYARGKEKNI